VEQIEITKMNKASDQPQPLPHWAKNWWHKKRGLIPIHPKSTVCAILDNFRLFFVKKAKFTTLTLLLCNI